MPTSTVKAGRAALVAGAVVLAYAGGLATGIVGSRSEQAATMDLHSAASQSGVLDEAAERIASGAARPVTKDVLERAAVDGMLKALGDRWSAYLPPADFASFSQGLEGRYSGVGLWLRTNEKGRAYVGSVLAGSPADDAGLIAGDLILAVDDQDTTQALVPSVAVMLRGAPGSPVAIKVSRDGATLTSRVVRSEVASDDVTISRLKGEVQVVRVAAFTRGVGRQVRAALLDLPVNSGVVLDLRSNPGGLLSEAVEVAGAFLDGGTVVSYEKRGESAHTLEAMGIGQTTVPVVVLVDDATASAAEVVAAALQDRGRAVVVGTRTYGKGSVQEPTTLSDGSAIELTVGRYRTPSGKVIDGIGVEPDISVRASLGSAAAERRAVEVLRGLVAAADTSGQG